MNDTDFGPRPSPSDKLLRPSSNPETTANTSAEAALATNANLTRTEEQFGKDLHRSQTSEAAYLRTTFYLNARQLDKLDDLARALSKHKRERLNRQDIIRSVVDNLTLEKLLEEWD